METKSLAIPFSFHATGLAFFFCISIFESSSLEPPRTSRASDRPLYDCNLLLGAVVGTWDLRPPDVTLEEQGRGRGKENDAILKLQQHKED
jgi:hypothetical protein